MTLKLSKLIARGLHVLRIRPTLAGELMTAAVARKRLVVVAGREGVVGRAVGVAAHVHLLVRALLGALDVDAGRGPLGQCHPLRLRVQ